MKPHELKQHGWITGPVECYCTGCDWFANFIAVDSSIPVGIADKFAAHKCTDYAPLFQFTRNKSEVEHETKIVHGSDRVHGAETPNTPPRFGPAAIIFLGSPGAGKGTQARHVASEYNLPHISTGDLFRSHVAKKTALGLQAAESMRLGMLVPDEVVCAMLTAHVHSLGSTGCLILDGFPRSLFQAKWLDRFLSMRSRETDDLSHNAPVAIQINIERDHLLRRLTGRRSCPSCGRAYNLYFQPPRTSGICDYDGAGLVMRPDDAEGVVSERLMVHDQNTLPVTEYYRRNGRLLEIDGNDTVAAVRSAIVVGLESVFASVAT